MNPNRISMQKDSENNMGNTRRANRVNDDRNPAKWADRDKMHAGRN